jgi:hypothetical protein
MGLICISSGRDREEGKGEENRSLGGAPRENTNKKKKKKMFVI